MANLSTRPLVITRALEAVASEAAVMAARDLASERARLDTLERDLTLAYIDMADALQLARDLGVEPVVFMDCNSPGVVYVGTQQDYNWLSYDGGCPASVGGVIWDDQGHGDETYVYRVQVCWSLRNGQCCNCGHQIDPGKALDHCFCGWECWEQYHSEQVSTVYQEEIRRREMNPSDYLSGLRRDVDRMVEHGC